MNAASSPTPTDSPSGDWQRASDEQVGLVRYAQILRERIGLVVLAVVVTLGAAVLYLAITPKTYQASADLLVTPVTGEELPTGLPLVRESSDPTRDVETVSRLVTTREVAGRARSQLPRSGAIDDLLGKVTAEPVAQSNIVAVTAKGGSPEEARDTANAFAGALVADRTAQLREALDRIIASLQPRAADDPAAGGPDSAGAQLARLQTLRAGPDPTIRLETAASTPRSASAPKPFITLAAALVAGLVLGMGSAFGLHTLDPRLRREEQLRDLYRVPVLARIPRETNADTSTLGRRRLGIGPRRKRRRALGPGALSPVTLEAYRTLRAMLAARRTGRAARSLLVTGPSPSEGKTTTAINLAASFALAGNRVILIEADFRRPTVGEALGVRPHVGIGKVLLDNARLEQALEPARPFGDTLKLLLVDRSDPWLPDMLSLPMAASLLSEAEKLADYVIIDSPPLTEVIDALPLAQQVDDVVVVLRLGHSRLTQLSRLSDLLQQNGVKPAGFALVGVGTSDKESYYLSARRERAESAEWGFEEPAGEPAPEGAGSARS